MKQLKYISSIFLFLIVSFFCNGSNNSCSILTDRDIYVSGEYSFVNVFLPVRQDLKIVYLALNSLDGNCISMVKLPVSKHQASGYIQLPDSLHSGSFLLTAYSPLLELKPFFRKEIFVLNRFDNIENSSGYQRAMLPKLELQESKQIVFSGLNSIYKTRTSAKLTIDLDETLLSELEGGLSVSISEFLPCWESEYFPVELDSLPSRKLTEEKGVVIQGIVSNKENGKPEPGATVYLSKPDSIPFFDYYITEDDGRFYFLLRNFVGKHSFILQATKRGENNKLKILMDKLPKNEWAEIPTKPLAMISDTREYFSNAIQMEIVKKTYQIEELNFGSVKYKHVYPFPFYGKAEEQIDPDMYLELPDFETISKELVPPLRFRTNENGYYVRLIDRKSASLFTNSPMLTIDGVPVSDISLLAKMGSKDIDWIDIVTSQCFFGGLKFDGVVAVYSRDLDASEIPLSDRILKIDCETLQEEVRLVDLTDDTHTPQYRKLLLWEPDVEVSRRISLYFNLSDVTGDFQVRITGRKKKGEIIQAHRTFTVTN